ncbi:MAG: ATP-dependent Clp protease proteolytic subunit [Hespellia sp.]|nr:ATP-dependent Clp protease proteolytic subunit [Hespellia sp.]
MKEKDDEQKQEEQTSKREEIKDTGTVELQNNPGKHKIQLLTIIGEIEGHEAASGNSKTTKYEHILPKLAQVEDDESVEGLLILLNTLGGDVEAGLAIAEMIASLSKPTVSLVLGGSHSIGGPLAVSADYSFIVPTGTMVVHPVRSNGMFIGIIQTYRNMEKTQDRITGFISGHSKITQKRLEELMLDSTQLVKDVGTCLEGEEAVREGLIDEVGGMSQALKKLYEMIDNQ